MGVGSITTAGFYAAPASIASQQQVTVKAVSTTDQTNFGTAIVTLQPTAWSISGVITGGSGATVVLSGTANASTPADASGNYTFAGLANGAYTVTPSKSGYTFSPPSQNVTINGANQVAGFTAPGITIDARVLCATRARRAPP